MIIPVRNSLTFEPWVPKTRSTHLEVAGTNNIRWENPNGFAASWAVQIGDTGEEQTEIMLLSTSTPAGTAGTFTANTLYEHPPDTPIYGIKYNQIIFEQSTTGTAGTASILTNGTVAIAPDNENTIFDDTTGSVSYSYKTMFRNSVLAVNTTESDWIVIGGYDSYALGRLRERTKEKLFSSKFIKSDTTINDWVNEWKDDMMNAAISVNENWGMGTVDIAVSSSTGLGTVSTVNFKQVKRFDVINGDGTNLSTKADSNDFQADTGFSASYPRHAWRGDNVFQVMPAGGTARLLYYTWGTNLNNDSDALPLPLRPYTKGCVSYCLAQAYRKDGKSGEYQSALAEYMTDRDTFLKEITPRDQSGQTMVTLVESITGEDYLW